MKFSKYKTKNKMLFTCQVKRIQDSPNNFSTHLKTMLFKQKKKTQIIALLMKTNWIFLTQQQNYFLPIVIPSTIRWSADQLTFITWPTTAKKRVHLSENSVEQQKIKHIRATTLSLASNRGKRCTLPKPHITTSGNNSTGEVYVPN